MTAKGTLGASYSLMQISDGWDESCAFMWPASRLRDLRRCWHPFRTPGKRRKGGSVPAPRASGVGKAPSFKRFSLSSAWQEESLWKALPPQAAHLRDSGSALRPGPRERDGFHRGLRSGLSQPGPAALSQGACSWGFHKSGDKASAQDPAERAEAFGTNPRQLYLRCPWSG